MPAAALKSNERRHYADGSDSEAISSRQLICRLAAVAIALMISSAAATQAEQMVSHLLRRKRREPMVSPQTPKQDKSQKTALCDYSPRYLRFLFASLRSWANGEDLSEISKAQVVSRKQFSLLPPYGDEWVAITTLNSVV
jgi:Ni/Co efflux regulator RcnB